MEENPYQSPRSVEARLEKSSERRFPRKAKRYRTNYLLWFALTVVIFLLSWFPPYTTHPNVLSGAFFGLVASALMAWIPHAIIVVVGDAFGMFFKDELPPPTDDKEVASQKGYGK
jgi:hypothetical protein